MDNDADNAIRNKLDYLIAEQTKANLLLEKMDGRYNLLEQVMKFHEERFKEHKYENSLDIERLYAKAAVQGEEINDLKRWKFYILGIMLAVGIGFQVVLAFVKSWFK